ncbi:MAG: hypothetical protein AVDCRST_MAG18-744 [uncultured Thermomicrobiales bacterium]|uniref:Uncharacterized protein n=1 Tax=uncultured Thermomicrobiales bacterium TaxID=1645740 RepID=A0A6J4URH8_9BACT|nr:MAG: hypothetical protein AVDCRST_MAG18-744 [uncultured Thermomicrobiales bacterium]
MPRVRYLGRLHRRNEFPIGSHHPLRETLLRQAGSNAAERAAFLRRQYATAQEQLVQLWAPREEGAPAF